MSLANAPMSTSFSGKNLPRMKKFYQDELGLNLVEENDWMLVFETHNGAKFFIYAKENHQPATYTVINFTVPNLETTIRELMANNVYFEQYPEMNTNELGISNMGGNKMAWMTDPDGNIIGIMEERAAE